MTHRTGDWESLGLQWVNWMPMKAAMYPSACQQAESWNEPIFSRSPKAGKELRPCWRHQAEGVPSLFFSWLVSDVEGKLKQRWRGRAAPSPLAELSQMAVKSAVGLRGSASWSGGQQCQLWVASQKVPTSDCREQKPIQLSFNKKVFLKTIQGSW